MIVYNATRLTPNSQLPFETIWGDPRETKLWPSIVLLITACISTALSICKSPTFSKLNTHSHSHLLSRICEMGQSFRCSTYKSHHFNMHIPHHYLGNFRRCI